MNWFPQLSTIHLFLNGMYVSLPENGETVAVKILRDTEANQSLLTANTFQLSDQSSIGASILIQGIGLGSTLSGIPPI